MNRLAAQLLKNADELSEAARSMRPVDKQPDFFKPQEVKMPTHLQEQPGTKYKPQSALSWLDGDRPVQTARELPLDELGQAIADLWQRSRGESQPHPAYGTLLDVYENRNYRDWNSRYRKALAGYKKQGHGPKEAKQLALQDAPKPRGGWRVPPQLRAL